MSIFDLKKKFVSSNNVPVTSIRVSAEEFKVVYDRFIDLSEKEDWLTALEAAGLDNWDGCDNAKDILEEWQSE